MSRAGVSTRGIHASKGVCGPLDDASAVPKSRPEDHTGIVEESLLEGNDDELAPAESRLEELPNMLSMAQIQCSIDFVQEIHGCGLEL